MLMHPEHIAFMLFYVISEQTAIFFCTAFTDWVLKPG